ncbi:hypothetical protein AB1Y20_014042 [Prymnesium parvum]|uniref:Methyltransferase domain-containing protein n=1 Tax=Prymnesium parvum TaxID=97485 RepID=A0AB34IHR4_PRYPA
MQQLLGGFIAMLSLFVLHLAAPPLAHDLPAYASHVSKNNASSHALRRLTHSLHSPPDHADMAARRKRILERHHAQLRSALARRALPSANLTSAAAHASLLARLQRMRGASVPPKLRVNMREYFQSNWNAGTPAGADCGRMRRVGPAGDGGKAVCFDALPPPSEPCFVLSVGVGGSPGHPPDFRFEIDLHRRLPHCTFHVYDGTNFNRGPVRNAPDFVKFFPKDFSSTVWRSYAGRHIDIFKIDCEGCEFNSFEPYENMANVEQLLVEVHGNNRHADVEHLMTELNKTHGIFYREPNIQYSDGTCIEFAFRNRGGRSLLQ